MRKSSQKPKVNNWKLSYLRFLLVVASKLTNSKYKSEGQRSILTMTKGKKALHYKGMLHQPVALISIIASFYCSLFSQETKKLNKIGRTT